MYENPDGAYPPLPTPMCILTFEIPYTFIFHITFGTMFSH